MQIKDEILVSKIRYIAMGENKYCLDIRSLVQSMQVWTSTSTGVQKRLTGEWVDEIYKEARMCVCVCVRACVRACVRLCV